MLKKLILALNLAASIFSVQSVSAMPFSNRPEVQQFIQELELESDDKKRALRALSQLESSAEIIERMNKPSEALSWDKYKKLLVSEKRIKDGVAFWNEQSTVLQQAQDKYGVPAEIIVAIIGIESSYGKNRGKYPVLQALATLAFDYPPRATFFKNELKEYLLLTTEQHIDPLDLNGSYAGAMGSPQFIASSYRKFAVDFDNSGKIDLVNNINHAIGSVGNYFVEHGWQTGKPVAYKATTKGSKFKSLPVAVPKAPMPTLSLANLKQHGVSISEKIKLPEEQVALLEFANGDKKEYWLGFNNFYVITRYNHSSNYAMAVYQLSQAISALHAEQALIKHG